MAHVIDDSCIACGSCEPECSVSAISPGDMIFEIDADLCTDCGDCVAVCPTDSIHPED